MKWSILGLSVLLACAGHASADRKRINEKELNRQKCAGMYSRKAWGGSREPIIQVDFEKQTPEGDQDPVISTIIFEWRDEKFVGRYLTSDAISKEYICDDENVQAKLCNSTQLGQFIVTPDAAKSTNPIVTQAVHAKDAASIKYPIKRTGYYCVGTYGFSAQTYKGVVEFRNSFGELSAAQIAKLPFYGGLTIVYAVIGIFWAFLYIQNRQDILPVQNYITAIIVILFVEMLMTWGFYDFQNRHGSTVLAKVLMVAVAVINAARNSFSFFLLLIVCLGYGVVKPTLGKTMLIVRGLAATHFVFGVIYAIASLSITPENAGPLVLLVVLPLSGTLTAFYVWTLNALNLTTKDLVERKQTVKALMYKKLWWCILASILVIFGFFFFNSFSFAGHKDPDYVPDHWQTRWFILDGWLNVVYLFDLAFIAYLWRPTANNKRFAMSDELAQEDEGFEVTSFGSMLDEDENDEEQGLGGDGNKNTSNNNTNNAGRSPADASAAATATPATTTPAQSSLLSATSAGLPKKPANVAKELPREPSSDGEPVFANAEEEADADAAVRHWSEDDDDDDNRHPGERVRLTSNKD